VFPGAGGGNWHGATFNPTLGLIITNVMDAGQWGHLGVGGRRRRRACGRAPPRAHAGTSRGR
jgi:quinoprotein glucose dehydrogenase